MAKAKKGSIQYLREKYGSLAWVLDIPELEDILRNADKKKWEPERALDELRQSKWWRKTSGTAREWYRLNKEDPATAQRKISSRQSQIKTLAAQLGVTIDTKKDKKDLGITTKELSRIASDSFKYGWSDQQLREAVAAQIQFSQRTKSPEVGEAGNAITQIRELAAAYAQPLSNSRLQSWTKKMIMGTADINSFRNTLAKEAASSFPGLKQTIMDGSTVREAAEPYVQLAQNTLEIPESNINIRDSKWNRFFNHQDDKGNIRPMTLFEAEKTMKSDSAYGFQYTKTARDQAFDTINYLSEAFGRK